MSDDEYGGGGGGDFDYEGGGCVSQPAFAEPQPTTDDRKNLPGLTKMLSCVLPLSSILPDNKGTKTPPKGRQL